MAVDRKNQGFAKRIRAAEVSASITATKSDRRSFADRIVALEAAVGLRDNLAEKTTANRRGLENRLRAIEALQS